MSVARNPSPPHDLRHAAGARLIPTFLFGFTASLVLCAPSAPAMADDDPVFVIEFKDGAITPLKTEVPANVRFKLELHNRGSSPVEFESVELRKEKVLGPGVTSFIVIRRLDQGEYGFFDDFHLGMPPATLVAK